MVKEVKSLTNIRLTESDTDGIWLHFDAKGLKAGVQLQSLSIMQTSGITAATIQNWAREQLDKQKPAHRRFYLHPEADEQETLEQLPPPLDNEFLKEGNEERFGEMRLQ